MRDEIPKATRRRSPPRARMPKPKRKGSVLERGVLDDEILAAAKDLDRYKRDNNRPFPAFSEVVDVLRARGWSPATAPQSDIAAADVQDMRESLAEVIKDLRRADMKRNQLACELNESRKLLRDATIKSHQRKKHIERSEKQIASLKRIIGRAVDALDSIDVEPPDRVRAREIRKEITRLRHEDGDLFSRDGVTAVQLRQAELEADVAVVVKAVAKGIGSAARTLERGAD